MTDIKDGELIASFDTDYKAGQTGLFDVVYTVTDSDGNISSEAIQIYVPKKEVYAIHVDWQSATVEWLQATKDTNISGNKIRVNYPSLFLGYALHRIEEEEFFRKAVKSGRRSSIVQKKLVRTLHLKLSMA